MWHTSSCSTTAAAPAFSYCRWPPQRPRLTSTRRMLLERIHYFAGIVFIAVAALLPIIDPFAGAPIYLAMTSDLTREERARTAKLVALNSFVLLLASILVGAYVLDFFGVSVPAVQVAGGVVVCAFAWSLLNGPTAPEVSASSAPPPRTASLSAPSIRSPCRSPSVPARYRSRSPSAPIHREVCARC